MRPNQIVGSVAVVVCLAFAEQALAQTTPPPNAPAAMPAPGISAQSPNASAHNVPTSPDEDEAFLTGLRRVGVMAGEVVQCSAGADKPAQISSAMDLANQIAIHFGLKAAFNYVGAVGYGSGHPIDKASCGQAIDGWKQVVAKYLNK